MEDVGAVILCGGHSRRMGRAKAWLPFGPGEVLLQRMVRLVGEAAGPVVVVAARGQELPSLPDSARIAFDECPDRGPLQGLAAGLAALPESAGFAYVTATDSPFLEPRWVRVLRDSIGEKDAAIPLILGRPHPLAALYRRSTVLPAIRRLLAADRLRLMELTREIRAVSPDESAFRAVDPRFRTVENLNSPEDYRRALDETFR